VNRWGTGCASAWTRHVLFPLVVFLLALQAYQMLLMSLLR
jgi:hypothetical protein